MADIYRVTWPFEVTPGHPTTAIPRYADCLNEETAKQVRDGLSALGYCQAVVFGVSPKAPGQVPGNAVDLTAPSKES